MTKLTKISKYLNFITIICFFLPFMVNDCTGPSAEELAEKTKTDSLSLVLDSALEKHENNAEIDTSSNVKVIPNENNSITLAQTNEPSSNVSTFGQSILKYIITPDSKNYSLIGIVISCFSLIIFGLYFFIIFMTLFFQFQNRNNYNILILLTIAILMLIIIYILFAHDLKIGFYVVFSTTLLMLIVEIIYHNKVRKQTINT